MVSSSFLIHGERAFTPDQGLPPPVPTAYQVYNSYAVDPIYQLRFTYAWLGLLTLVFVLVGAGPRLVAWVASRRFLSGHYIFEDLSPSYHPVALASLKQSTAAFESTTRGTKSPRQLRPFLSLRAFWSTVVSYSIRFVQLPKWAGGDGTRRGGKAFIPLTVGQLVLAGAYAAAVWVCVVRGAQLMFNPNRLGFIAVAQLTPLFLVATKNNPLSVLLGFSYEKFNWAHRWLGRMVFLCATCHGAIWLWQFRNDPTFVQKDKTVRGIIAFSFLCLIVVSSLKPVRTLAYQLFWTFHFLSFIGFFAALAYHTPYAQPWIFPPVAFYSFDLFMRLLKSQVKDAYLIPVEGMTVIHIPDVNRGWHPTQFVSIRVLSSSWSLFETHPFTILSSPSPPNAPDNRQGITLLAGVSGDWTRQLHKIASTQGQGDEDDEKKEKEPVSVKVIVDGPYGGLSGAGISRVEEVVCIAAGSGISFLLGLAEEVARIRREEERIRVVRLVWIVREFATFHSLLPFILPLLSSSTTLTLYLTSPTSASSSPPPSPFITITPLRPHVSQLLRQILEDDQPREGVEVVACGPPMLVAEVRNAVGALNLRQRVNWGGVSFTGEGFGL